MTQGSPRNAERNRWRREIVRHLTEFPRQYAALESAMAAFGGDFDLKVFKAAYETTDDMEAYNRVQAVERAFGRVQNFVAELTISGIKLAQLPKAPLRERESTTAQAFEALRAAGVIDANLCNRLIRGQNARSRIEHAYIDVPAGDVHRAAELVHDTAIMFIGRYRAWIEPYLDIP